MSNGDVIFVRCFVNDSIVKRSDRVVNEVHDFRMTWEMSRSLSLMTLNISRVVKSVESSYQLKLGRYHFAK